MSERKEEGKRIKVRLPLLALRVQLLIFLVLAALTVVFLRPLQQNFRDRIEGLKDTYIQLAEGALGRGIQYESMGPSLFGTLDLRNILVLREDGSVSLSIARLRFSFSILKLLFGNSSGAFNSVRVDRPVLNLDFEKDADLARRFRAARQALTPAGPGGEAGDPGARSLRDLLPENFSLRIWNGEWDLSGSLGAFNLRGVGFDAVVREGRVSFQGRWNAAARLAEGVTLPAILTPADSGVPEAILAGRISGEYEEEMGSGSATVTIPSVSGSFFRLSPVSISCFLSGSRLEIRKAYDKSPLAFSLLYDIGRNELRGRFEGEKFSLDEMLVFTGPWRDRNPALAFEISGSADILRESSGNLEFGADFSGAAKESSSFKEAFLDLHVAGNRELVTIDNFDIRSPLGDLSFQGGFEINSGEIIPLAPFGALSFSDLRLRGDEGLSGGLLLSTNGRYINVSGEDFRAGNVALSGLDLSLNWDERAFYFDFSAQRSRNIGFLGDTRTGLLSLSGEAGGNPPGVRAGLRLDSFSVGDILSLAEPFVSVPPAARSAAGDLFLSTDLSFNGNLDAFSYSAPLVAASYEGLGDVLASVSVSGSERGIELSGGNISWENGSAGISGSVDYSSLDDISFSAEAVFLDVPYSFEGNVRDRRHVDVRGPYGFQIYVSDGAAGNYSGYAQAEKFPVPSGEKTAALSFLVSLAYNSASSWRAGIERFELSGLTTPASSSALVHFSGVADERGLAVPNFFFDDGQGALAGTVGLDWDADYSYIRFRTDIAGNARSEHYGLNGTYRDKLLDLSFSGSGMQFSRFTSQNAVADASLELSWRSPVSFEAESEISSFALRRNGQTLRASANISVNDKTIESRQLSLSYAGLEAEVPYLRLDRSEARAEMEAGLRGILAKIPVDMRFKTDMSFGASSSWIDLLRDFSPLDGSLLVSSARYADIEATEPFSFTFNCLGGEHGYTLSALGGPKDMLRLRYATDEEGAGVLYGALSAPSPVRGTFSASIASGNIEAQIPDLYADMGSLWRFVPPTETIEFQGGIVTGSVRIQGPLRAPEFFGSARGNSLRILVPQYFSETIRPVPVHLLLTGNEISFGPVDAVVGQGGGKVSGWFGFDEWIPNSMNLDIQVTPEHPVPYDLDISGIIARGTASGNMTLALEDRVLAVSGELTGYDTEISLDAAELGALESLPFSAAADDERKIAVTTDIAIKAGRRVEFFWPSFNFPVIQAYADMGTGIRFQIDTYEHTFSLTGDVGLRGGEIFYLERNFYIREGTLFFRESESQFNPLISARAEIRDRVDTGPVTISMILDAAPLRSFSPTFVSNPPLSQLEIYSLLGQVPQIEEGQRNLAVSLALDGLAQNFLINRLQRQVRNFMGLDMLSVRTQFLQNMVYQFADGESGGRNFRGSSLFDNSTIFGGKYFGSFFLEGLVSFRYDENETNSGGLLNVGGLLIEPEIGFEMNNPLFDLRFSFSPTHLENLFMNDVSFEITKRISF